MQFTNMEFVLNKKVDQGAPWVGGCTLQRRKVDQGAPWVGGCTVSRLVGLGLGRDSSCTVSCS
jgi:hypothetical protein